MESKLELQPLMSLFQEEMAQDCQLETQAFAADTTTVSPDGCAWCDYKSFLIFFPHLLFLNVSDSPSNNLSAFLLYREAFLPERSYN